MLHCPKCGIANAADRTSCSVCGAPLASASDSSTEESNPSSIPPAPKTIPGVAAAPRPPQQPAKTLVGVAAAEFEAPRSQAQTPVSPGTVPGIAATPPTAPSAGDFKKTMMGLAPSDMFQPADKGPTGTASHNPLGFPQAAMTPAKPSVSPFQTLLGVAPDLASNFAPKNEAQQTLLGAGEFSNPQGTVQLNANSAKGTLIGVAIPGIAPINPGIEKPANVEPSTPPVRGPSSSDSKPPAPTSPAPTSPSSRRYLGLALTVAAVFLGLVTLLAIGWWRATPRLSVSVRTDELGADSLEVTCANCDDGSQISLAETSARFVGHRALLPLRQPLKMGDNTVSLRLARVGAKQETIQLRVPVDYRVLGDVTGIEEATPNLRLLVDRSKNVSFEVEGQPLSFDSAGHARYELDITKDVTGQASSEKALQKRVSYTVKTASGDITGAISMQVGVLPLVVDAPGPLLITDRSDFKLCGYTMPGSSVDVAGLKIIVEKDGRFCHPMLIKELGRFSIWVTARAKGFAPRRVERIIERTSDLSAYAKKLYKDIPHELKKRAAVTDKDNSALVGVVGTIVELSESPPITRALLRLEPRYNPEGLARVVATNQPRFAAGQLVTVFGQITGSLLGPDGRDLPEVTTAFIMPGAP